MEKVKHGQVPFTVKRPWVIRSPRLRAAIDLIFNGMGGTPPAVNSARITRSNIMASKGDVKPPRILGKRTGKQGEKEKEGKGLDRIGTVRVYI